ncbi:sirohydrochlorin chelatase [Microbacterium excoecariae]|uniref:sirohydrochlorin chelatase n=1 Tax=Microbacterium excoecariae TaxID=2715210 RepID=UPI001408EF5F|nr:sirohydrochlorin chelatase [Microbacterium excoecariae]NHI16816.1 sirohydrochlorin chelatase [Microbacterium excoecariae]
MSAPALICCSHGTDSPEGRSTISRLVAAAARAIGDVPVRETYVDVQHPQVDEVVAATPGDAVVVPLLLSPGFHTSVDIGRAARSRPGVVATDTLGPHPLLADILAERVAALRPAPGDAVVLAASGSSRPEAAESVERVRDALTERLGRPVGVGYAYGATPKVAEAVADARRAGAGRVIVASYVLAPGHFARLVAGAGADATTAPLGDDPRVAEIVAERYRAGCLLL